MLRKRLKPHTSNPSTVHVYKGIFTPNVDAILYIYRERNNMMYYILRIDIFMCVLDHSFMCVLDHSCLSCPSIAITIMIVGAKIIIDRNV